MHPKEAEHQERKRQLQMASDRDAVVAEHLKNKHKLRFVHVRCEVEVTQPQEDGPTLYLHVKDHKGGVTVAYARPYKGSRTVTVAIANVHENDNYCKRIGRLFASRSFDAGKTITIHVPRNKSVPFMLNAMFQPTLQ